MAERLCMSGRNGPTKTTTKRSPTSKPHLSKRGDYSSIYKNKTVHIISDLGHHALTKKEFEFRNQTKNTKLPLINNQKQSREAFDRGGASGRCEAEGLQGPLRTLASTRGSPGSLRPGRRARAGLGGLLVLRCGASRVGGSAAQAWTRRVSPV